MSQSPTLINDEENSLEKKQEPTLNDGVNESAEDTNVEEPKEDQKDDPGPPDGGIEAWGVLLGSTLTFLMSFGVVQSFGVFQEYYVSTLLNGKANSQPSTVSWIGSCQAGMMFIGGLLFGALTDRFGARPVMTCGGLCYIIACMLVSLCHEFWQLFLSQAILLGLSISALFTPPFAIISEWFDKKRGLAIGLVTAGSSIGGVIWPIAMRQLINRVGFPWTFRIVGFIALGLFIPALVLVKNRIRRQPPKSLFNFAAFLDPKFTFFALGQLCNFFGFYFIIFYLPSLAVRFGLSESMASYSLAILNAVSFFGRLIPGMIADKIGRFNVLVFSAISSGIITLCILAVNSGPGVIVIGAFYGFFSGSLISIQGACMPSLCKNPNQIGTNMGMLMLTISISGLLGGPVAGWLVEYDNGDYTSASIFAGVVLLAGAVFILGSKLCLNRNILAKI